MWQIFEKTFRASFWNDSAFVFLRHEKKLIIKLINKKDEKD